MKKSKNLKSKNLDWEYRQIIIAVIWGVGTMTILSYFTESDGLNSVAFQFLANGTLLLIGLYELTFMKGFDKAKNVFISFAVLLLLVPTFEIILNIILKRM